MTLDELRAAYDDAPPGSLAMMRAAYALIAGLEAELARCRRIEAKVGGVLSMLRGFSTRPVSAVSHEDLREVLGEVTESLGQILAAGTP